MQIQLKHFLISDWENLLEEFFLQAKALPTNLSSIPFPQHCRNLALGSWPMQGLTRAWAKKEAQESHLMLLGVWESVRMNTHTPKWTPILGVKIPMYSQFFRERFQRSKPIRLKSSLYHWKAIKTYMSEMGSHDPFKHLKHKLWPKERLGIKLPIWLPTTKSQESTQFPCGQVAYDIPLEIFWRELQLCYRSHLNQRSVHKVMGPQSFGNPNFGNSRLPFGSPRTKMSFGCGPCGEAQSIL
jgi:hypothetical protein